MAQQTAVEWLVNQEISVDLGSGIKMKIPIPQNVIDKAKEMEKEQLNKAYYKGQECKYIGGPSYCEQYYNETYGNEGV